MEFFVVLIVLGAAAYFFIRGNTRRGANTVRAFVYMRAIKCGASVEGANEQAQLDVANAPTETIQDAMAFVRLKYGGKQLPLIEDAKQAGLVLSKP